MHESSLMIRRLNLSFRILILRIVRPFSIVLHLDTSSTTPAPRMILSLSTPTLDIPAFTLLCRLFL